MRATVELFEQIRRDRRRERVCRYDAAGAGLGGAAAAQDLPAKATAGGQPRLRRRSMPGCSRTRTHPACSGRPLGGFGSGLYRRARRDGVGGAGVAFAEVRVTMSVSGAERRELLQAAEVHACLRTHQLAKDPAGGTNAVGVGVGGCEADSDRAQQGLVAGRMRRPEIVVDHEHDRNRAQLALVQFGCTADPSQTSLPAVTH